MTRIDESRLGGVGRGRQVGSVLVWSVGRDSEGFGVAGWLWNGAKGCGCSGSGKVAHGKAGVDGKTCSGRAVLGWAIPIRWGRQVVAWRVAFGSGSARLGMSVFRSVRAGEARKARCGQA